MQKNHTQVVLVSLQPFWRNSLLKCALQPKICEKFTKILFYENSKSYTIINVSKFKKKPVASACGDKRTYLSATFFTLREPIAVE